MILRLEIQITNNIADWENPSEFGYLLEKLQNHLLSFTNFKDLHLGHTQTHESPWSNSKILYRFTEGPNFEKEEI